MAGRLPLSKHITVTSSSNTASSSKATTNLSPLLSKSTCMFLMCLRLRLLVNTCLAAGNNLNGPPVVVVLGEEVA